MKNRNSQSPIRRAFQGATLAVALGGLLAGCQTAPASDQSAGNNRTSVDPLYGRLEGRLQSQAQAALQDALESNPSGQALSWRDDGGKAAGSVVPLRTFKIQTGHFCREFRETLEVDGVRSEREAVACRSEKGEWVKAQG